jgi:hypothetical protein
LDTALTTIHTRLVGSSASTRARIVSQVPTLDTDVPPYLMTTQGFSEAIAEAA